MVYETDIVHLLSLLEKRTHWPKVKMSMLKTKIKCLSSWDANAGFPLMVRLPSHMPKPCWLAVYMLICVCVCFLELYPWLVKCSLFWQDIKLCWKPCFSRAVSQSHLGRWSLGYSPQFGSDKIIFYSFLFLAFKKKIIWLCWVLLEVIGALIFVAACKIF